MADIEKIQEDYQTFETIIEKLDYPGFINFIKDHGENLVMSPAAAQKDEYGCFPGGIIDMALKLSQSMRKLNLVAEYDIDAKDIYVVAFLRAIAEGGDSTRKMFEPHDSDWHVEKLGLLYKRNPDLNGTTWTTRAIEIAITYKIDLTSDQVMAIMTAEGDKPFNNLARLLKSANTLLIR